MQTLMLNTPRVKNYIPAAAVLLVLISFLGIFLSRKQSIVIKKGSNHTQLAAELVKKSGLKIYPKSKIINGTLIQSPLPAKKTDKKQLVTFVYLWLETSDSIQNVQNFYKKKMPFVISEKKTGEGVIASQLSSAASFSQAVQAGKPKISFLEIRRQALPDEDRKKIQIELDKLSQAGFPTPSQNRRKLELERLLTKETLVKITLRLLYL